MIKKNDLPNNWECQGDGTEHENQIITDNYNLNFALLNVSPDSSDTFTASFSPTNFCSVPVKTINPFGGYSQKLTNPKNLHIPGSGGSRMDLASLKSFFDEPTRFHVQYLHEKYRSQDDDTPITSEWRHA